MTRCPVIILTISLHELISETFNPHAMINKPPSGKSLKCQHATNPTQSVSMPLISENPITTIQGEIICRVYLDLVKGVTLFKKRLYY